MEQCTDLPKGFEISNIGDILMVSGVNIPRESFPSPGRNIDRSVGGSRSEHCSGGDDDRWNKPSPVMLGRVDIRADAGYASNMIYGVLRNPRAQAAAHYSGGIRPVQSVGQSGVQRNNSVSDRWQRRTAFQKGLVSSPQMPPPVMHKADKKYEIGKVAYEEVAKQRQLKAILNKLTPQNFKKLFQEVKEVNIDNVVTMAGVISQIFDKALMEPTFCEMYADFCFHLAADLPDLSVDNERITFKRLLLNKHQEEFERGEREEEEANKAEEGEVKQTAEDREEKRLQTRRRMLGNIRLIGELYKKRMLTERIMHECISKLLGQYQNPKEKNIEALCKLMSTIGEMIDHPKTKDRMDAYFDIMAQLSNNMKLSSRVRFMLKDAIDLRKNEWQQRREVEGPKKIDEVHRDAAQEWQAQASRSTRAPSMGNPAKRGGPSMDFSPRNPSTLSSPGSHMGGFRGGQSQLRGYGSQDARSDDRHSFDNRTMSHPLPQRPLGDDSITLGPQGGLMSFRGRPSTPNDHSGEILSSADARRIGPGLNGLGPVAGQTTSGRREDLMPRYMPGRVDTPSNVDRLHPRDRNTSHGSKEVGLIQSVSQSGIQRNTSESDRWQCVTAFQKGLVSSPQMPPPMMHKADKKYELGKVAYEEVAKQRQLKAILNKLTPQNFEKLFQQVKEVNIDNVVTMAGVISQIFDKALMEPTFCEMYADICFHLAADLPDLSVDNERITFKRLLLNKHQEEFERGEREEEEANKAEEGEVKQTAEDREGNRLQTRRRMLGNIQLIGELYKKRMLTERIMHECINKLLGQCQNPEEENIEALCKLMSTIGEIIDHPKTKDRMDAYFDIMAQLSNNMKLSSRVRFMLKDAIDLRKNEWQQRRKVEGPKKIDEVHRDAAQEWQAQASRSTRAPSMGNPARREGPSMDFSPRNPSTLSSPGSHMGGFRGGQSQLRGYGSQDARSDDRHSFDNRTMSHPLPQRPLGDDSITLGPQGGLMSFRVRPSTPNDHSGEILSSADARRIGPGLNALGPVAGQTASGRREDLMPRYMPDRFDTPCNVDQLHPRDRNTSHGSKEVGTDHSYDRSMLTSPQDGRPNTMHNVSSENVWTEEQLRDKSLVTIREFYSARDEKEVALCIKDLNAPSFYPSMISIWVIDSFERKEMERELLTRLLINLSKPRDGLINQDQLIKGSESILAVLEDAVNDAPKAAEFLGCIFARVILENIIPLSKIGQLICEGGEEPGSLVEAGLAAEVMGSILGMIKSEKGDSVVNEMLAESNLKLENFKPLGWKKTSKIDEFM